MILRNQKENNVIVEGENTARSASIDSRKLSKLHYILTKALYTDAKSAVITEISNNGVDSITESGKDPIQNPVVVDIRPMGYSKWKLSIKDNGIGMDQEFFENRFMNLLDSTKEESDDTIGAWGIGGKSWASLNKPVTFTIVKNGLMCKYLCYQGAQFIDFDPLIINQATTEQNGVLFEMELESYESGEYIQKAKRQLSYYDTVVLRVNGSLHQNTIYRNKLFQWCQTPPYNEVHIALKDVVYSINWNKLGIPSIPLPIALRVSLGEGLEPTPSREDFLYSPETIALIKDKLAQVADFFVDKYNENLKNFKTFREAEPFIDTANKVVTLNGGTFIINPLLSYATKTTNNVTVDGYNTNYLSLLKRSLNSLTRKWETVGHVFRGKVSKSYYSRNVYINHKEQLLLVDSIPTGNLREYMKQKYEGAYLLKDIGKRRLWEKAADGTVRATGTNIILDYYHVLNLKSFIRSEWREVIRNCQKVEKEYESVITDMRKFVIPQDWLDERKKNMIRSGKSTALNKQQGEMTVYFPRKMHIGSDFTFDKKKLEVEKVRVFKGLQVYFTVKDKDRAASLARLLRFNEKINVKIFNETEIKHVQGLNQFKSYKQFMETQAFRRLATARRAAKILERYRRVKDFSELIEVCKFSSKKFANTYDEIMRFLKAENMLDTKDGILVDGLGADIDKIASQHNLYDLRIIKDVIDLEENFKTFEFFQYLALPKLPSWSSDIDKQTAYRPFIKLINQMLLFRKLKYKEIEEFEIVYKKPEEIATDPKDSVPLVDEEDTESEEGEPFPVAVVLEEL